MKIKPIIVPGCLALCLAIAILMITSPPTHPESNTISVRDGSGLSGVDILNAAHSLSADLPVEIRFRTPGRSPHSITALSRRAISDFPCDWMSVYLKGEQIQMNEEVLSEEDFLSRLATYSESARIAEATTLLILAADENTTGEQLVAVLQVFADTGITSIMPAYTHTVPIKISTLTPEKAGKAEPRALRAN